MLKRATTAFLVAFNIGLGLVLLYLLSRGATTQAIEYKDFISILLSALAVMIAVVTLMAGLAAIWGFALLREEARAAAADTARAVASQVAKDIAESVATRTARDTAPAETTPGDAKAIANAMMVDDGLHGSNR